MAGMASAHALCNAGTALSFPCQTAVKKNCLSLAMAKKLLQAVLPIHSITRKGVLDIVKYHLKRNYIAYQSHRKKQIAVAKKLGVLVSL
ncbi:hypothetical protein [Desulfobacter vibrioformis]|uniref:hypothetical protein n=1 Tax=Desulfobacter vibrioformis TaxID=34031 RepID=UPI000554D20F|nr:hypothetical protein [Desulfobacter vibrioformis]